MFDVAEKHLLRGPNRFANRTVLYLRTMFDCGTAALREPVRPLAGFASALAQAPGGAALADLLLAASGRLRPEGCWLDLIVELVSILQERHMVSPARGTCSATSADIRAVVPVDDELVGAAAWNVACGVALAAMEGDAGDGRLKGLTDAHRELVATAVRHSPDMLTLALMRAANVRNIPFYRLGPGSSAVQFGEGRQLRLASLPPQRIANPDKDVVARILRQAFPPGRNGRIPTAGITGSMGKTTTCRMVAGIVEAAGLKPGLSTTQGAWSGSHQIRHGDSSGGGMARKLLLDPTVDVGVFELARGALLNSGMVIDGIEVGAVLNVHDNHVGLDGIGTREQMAKIKAIVARRARRWAFLNAADPLVMAMRPRVTARLGLVALDPANPLLARHSAEGGCVVTLEDGVIRVKEGGSVRVALPAGDIPAARGGGVRALTENALFAAGIAHGLGLSEADIHAGLSRFVSDASQNPGRYNWIDGLPFRMLLHWADGVPATAEAMEMLRAETAAGRRLLVAMAPGNRSDEWITAIGSTIAGHFDRYFCVNMNGLRGRAENEVPDLMAKGLRAGGVCEEAIGPGGAHVPALEAALREARPGDLVVCMTYETTDALAVIERHRATIAAG